MLASPANRRKLYGLLFIAIMIVLLYSLSDYAAAGSVTEGGKKGGKKLRIGMFMARGE